MNSHALKDHLGITVFIDIASTQIILINYPKNIVINKTLYTDKFGQDLESDKTNWGDYKRNKENFEYLKGLINEYNIPQEICYQIENLGKKVRDSIM